MAVNIENYNSIIKELADKATLVAVSKMKSASEIKMLYDAGQKDFGENYVQELVDKQAQLPADIRWHFIGHLQSNKVKYIAPFVHLIHAVDSVNLIKEINKQARNCDRSISVLLQVHIAEEQTKFGLTETALGDILSQKETFKHVQIAGLMGMATFTDDMQKVEKEFSYLHALFQRYQLTDVSGNFNILSMGMSDDYRLAVQHGSNMVRIGSLLFGARPLTGKN